MALVQTLSRFDRTGWRPVSALLRFLGVTVAVLVGLALAGRGGAVLAGLGALYAGMASFGGVHQARLKRMVLATLGATATTFVGCLVGTNDVLTVVFVVIGAFLLSLLGAAGADAAQVATQATAILVVLSGLQGSSAFPLGNAALVMGGGLGQALILMLFHPISPVAAERRAMEGVYAGLARFASSGGKEAPLPSAAPHAAARDLLRSAFSYGSRPELLKLWTELELADAIRGNLSGLARVGAQREVWEALAEWLEAAADEIARGRAITRKAPEFGLSLLSPLQDEPLGEGELALPWLKRIQAMIEAEEEGRMPVGIPPPRSWLLALKNVETVRALALGHALRYSFAVGVATAVYRWFRVDHGYWAALAVAFSLRPDFATTIVRSVGRIVGTAIGVGLATAFVFAFHPQTTGLTLGMLAAVWFAFSLQNATYVGFSAGLAFYVVMSVSLSGLAFSTAGIERVGATAAGSIFALAVAVLWPKWEAGNVRSVLAAAFATQAEYALAVAESRDAAGLDAARFQARAARLEAERTVSAAGFEPWWLRRRHLEGAGPALSRLAENAARILAVHVAGDRSSAEDLRRLAAEDRGTAADLMG
ncbi:hypothetical protein EON82_12325 [bacterium]|nr:MAG: hypothetical protein EON82_12325 [bacterium]